MFNGMPNIESAKRLKHRRRRWPMALKKKAKRKLGSGVRKYDRWYGDADEWSNEKSPEGRIQRN